MMQKLTAISTCVTTMESRVEEKETCITTAEETIAGETSKRAEKKANLAAALEKFEDLENRGKQCNIRITGLPKSGEGTNAVSFLHSWLLDVRGLKFKHGHFKIDR